MPSARTGSDHTSGSLGIIAGKPSAGLYRRTFFSFAISLFGLCDAGLCSQRFAAFRARWLGGDPISYGAIYRMLAGVDLMPELPRIACPVLAIAGTLDRTRPPLLVEPVARAIPGARYVVLETGHYAPIQTPELYARTVDEFLNAIDV